MKILVVAFLLMGAMSVFSESANSARFYAASDALCNKMKQCALDEMGNMEGMPENMVAMIEQTLGEVCKSIRASYQGVNTYPELYDHAAACMESMTKLSCGVVTDMDDTKTKECQEYQEALKKYES